MTETERKAALKRAWALNNKDKLRAYRIKAKDKIKAYRAAYYAANKKEINATRAIRNAEAKAHAENDRRNAESNRIIAESQKSAREKEKAEKKRCAELVKIEKARIEEERKELERLDPANWDRKKCMRNLILCESYMQCQKARLGMGGVWVAPGNTDSCYREMEVKRNLFRSSLNGNINIGIR